MKYIFLGVKSIRRIGMGAFACLVIGCVMLELALIMTWNISDKKHTPCELTAYASDISDGDIKEIFAIDGVVSATAVIEYQSVISVGDYSQSITVYGIDPDYITDLITDGMNFPEQSQMPYVVLNKKSMTGFTDGQNKAVYSDSISWQDGLSDMSGRAIAICGIADDGKETPCGYTNISALKSVILEKGGAPEYSFVRLRLSGIGYEERVIKYLSNIGFDAVSDTAELREELKNDTAVTGYISAGGLAVLFAAAVIVFNKSKADYCVSRNVYKTLIYFGAGKKEIALIYAARIFAFAIISIAASLPITVFVRQLQTK